MRTRTGLVLAGGGTAGVSWTYGLLAGLVETGRFDPSEPEIVIGTSAGSVVGANLCGGSDLAALAEAERTFEPGSSDGSYLRRADPEAFGMIFGHWMGTDPMTREVAREIGTRAIDACGLDPGAWIGAISQKLSTDVWSQQLVVTAVACEAGERVAWRANDGLDLIRCVAASCAVPSLAPVIRIGDRAYMDGGVWSVTNADLLLASGVDRALIVCPQTGLLKDVARAALARETAQLESAGITVTAVVPGDGYEDLGPNVMDPRLRSRAAEEGFRDAERLSPSLRW